MKVITMESSAYKEMMAQIANIAGYIREARDEKKRKRAEWRFAVRKTYHDWGVIPR